ncbi:alpha/beta fold hydrolase [Antrihabitans stalactiti]|uniref:Alpha/beta hydrolase n=1 Tax=Antrihabitans stalactiti TaxID=2584121 RepID=A0A848KEW5_9NOCA|nr:alpha/beta hydrolase [Antrihabitans stalactiti]NMN94497.1 alpha/beta hydrolase [Antrihabitans stalactiti]
MQIDGHNIHVKQHGPDDGVPVTLLHGFPTSSEDWALVMPYLTDAGCRVTTLDFLGFGNSDKPVGHSYSLIEQATIVESVWAELGITTTALVAHDYGVSVGQELLARDSSRITRMTWMNGGLYPDLHRPIAIQRLLHSPVGAVLALAATERTFTASLRKILGRPVSDEILHEMWISMSQNNGRRVQHALLRYIDERRENKDRWQAALEKYAGPTLFVWGPADPISGGHVLERLRVRIPTATFTVLDDAPAAGHYPQVESPAEVGRALAEFLGSA